MKSNEWLAYFMEQHRADMTTIFGATPAAESVVRALEDDFSAEVCEAAPTALRALTGSDTAAAAALWRRAEQQIGDYIANEEELSGGARRLAYLRLSDFSMQMKAALK